MKKYVGTVSDMDWSVTVEGTYLDDDGKPAVPHALDPRLDIVNHSPDGFSWGYYGSGPAQLALAILADATNGHPTYALANYQAFKREVISGLDKDRGFTIGLDDVVDWMERHQSEFHANRAAHLSWGVGDVEIK